MTARSSTPDTILFGGKLTTLDRSNPVASAVAITDGVFTAVGDDKDVLLCGLAPQIVDQDLRVHLFLDVERRRAGDKVRSILLVLAAPDQLRVKIAITPLVGHSIRNLQGGFAVGGR
jgi:hypothetical protein